MTAMVEDLFQLSRATSGTLQLTLEPLALAEIASDAVAAESTPTSPWWRRRPRPGRRCWAATPTSPGCCATCSPTPCGTPPAGGTVRLSAGTARRRGVAARRRRLRRHPRGRPAVPVRRRLPRQRRPHADRAHRGGPWPVDRARPDGRPRRRHLPCQPRRGLPHGDHARRRRPFRASPHRGSPPHRATPHRRSATKARSPGRSATTASPSGAASRRSTAAPTRAHRVGGPTRPRCAPAPSPPVPLGRGVRLHEQRSRRRRAVVRRGRAAAPDRRRSRCCRRRAARAPTGPRRARGRTRPGAPSPPRAPGTVPAPTAEWSTPRAGTPRRASPTSSRPGPQPRSTVGPVHRSSSQASSASAGPRHRRTGRSASSPSLSSSVAPRPVSAASNAGAPAETPHGRGHAPTAACSAARTGSPGRRAPRRGRRPWCPRR